MNVLLINGSPREAGCTFTALSEVAGQLNDQGIATTIFQLERAPISGCIACGACRKAGQCVTQTCEPVNQCAELLKKADGLIVGSPVYYAGPNGALLCLLDRMFFSQAGAFAYKPAAAVVSCRRAGSTAALDRLNKYFTISNMPVVPSQYWNMVHGNNPDEVRQDLEGMQIMRTLGRNMAWLLKCIQAAEGTVPRPQREQPHQATNFIR
jgi:multimeric flavodoxin WrbA